MRLLIDQKATSNQSKAEIYFSMLEKSSFEPQFE